MDYLTAKGIETRTGVELDSLPGFLTKELLDNAVDSVESQHLAKPEIIIRISKTDSFVQLNVSNTSNETQVFSKRRLESIFNFDRTYRRNQYKITRGALGDAFKEIICIPYALARENKIVGWNQPLIIRDNQRAFKVNLVINQITKHFHSKIYEQELKFDLKNDLSAGTIDVQICLPLTNNPNSIIERLREFLILYAFLNPHIGFSFYIQDEFLKFPQTQPILAKWSNQTSIYHYSVQEFEDFISGLENHILQIYNVLYNTRFREVSNLPKAAFPQMTIGQLKQSPKDIEKIYKLLRNRLVTNMGPPAEISLPFNTTQSVRRKAIVDRIKQVGISCKLVKYKQKSAYYNMTKNDVQIPFFYEVTIIHSNFDDIRANLDLTESLNTSTMPNNYPVFCGDYEDTFEWYSGKSDNPQNGTSIMDIFRKYGYSHGQECKKKHSIIIANLISPRIDFRSYGKSTIDVMPFAGVIAEITAKACRGGGGGNSDGNQDKKKASEIFQNYLKGRLRQVQNDPKVKLTDPWNTSTPVYRIRPVLEKAGLGHLKRKYLQGLVRKVCVEKLKRNREDFGIYEKAHAQLYFKGEIYDVTYDNLREITKVGFAILVIEKSGVVKLLASYANNYGLALCETTGFLSDNAKKLCELSYQNGANVAILTDNDMSGRLIASKVPKVPRIGITLQTLKRLRIPLEEVAENLSKKSAHADKVTEAFSKGDIKITEDDWTFLNGGDYGRRIEIDNVIGYVGAKRFWEDFIIKDFRSLFPLHDYTRSIDIPEYVVPMPLQKLNDLVRHTGTMVFKSRREELLNKLSNIRGGLLFDRTNRILPEYTIGEYEENLAVQSRKIVESNETMRPLVKGCQDLLNRMQRSLKNRRRL